MQKHRSLRLKYPLLNSVLRSQPSGARNQAIALDAEGVQVQVGALGELFVDFGGYGWFPNRLPSEMSGAEDNGLSQEDEE